MEFPERLEEISLNSLVENKRKIINGLDGKFVYIKRDEDIYYFFGKIEIDKKDSNKFYLEKRDGIKVEIYYRSLEGLLVVEE